ncbi:Putative flippase GtrA (transmembrane translocase of bactoprenol-linked glucose) [Pseudoxanthomonas sp. GM95]|uniref:GtrA family protein n=1 Tax=Pseudoxanthomonas sp. GM95 TaxID=1881043 RepID=UPI0008B0F6C8|nr:GtrA family protein [Pseudoxanthomonas sp. GM95]SEL44726.1 Putative flippase GtrA (transmembrane translocase of bactoprenol-linked glucose) [Pseudoxanthomonas sp. GM95]
MSLIRQSRAFIVVGVLQLLVDWSVFVALSAIGVDAVPANLCGRVAGAMLGFWLNGRYTFASQDDGARLGWARFWKFLAVWIPATFLSTWLIVLVEHHLGLQLAWLAKPLVEGGLAVLTFLAGRYLIYR